MADERNKNLKDFIISLNLKNNPVEELRYDKTDGELRIYITPKNNNLTIEDFEFSHDGEETSLENIRVLGGLMARLRFNKEKNVFWSAILIKDGVKQPIGYKELTEELRNHVTGIKTLIIFNEKGPSFAWSENKSGLQTLARNQTSQFHDEFLEFSLASADLKNEINRILGLF